jgi:hypothetical protein
MLARLRLPSVHGYIAFFNSVFNLRSGESRIGLGEKYIQALPGLRGIDGKRQVLGFLVFDGHDILQQKANLTNQAS